MKLLAILLLAGCATASPKTPSYEDRCGTELRILNAEQSWLPEDDKRIAEFRAGCVQRFGANSCLLRVTKIRPQGYTVVCAPQK